MIILAAGLLLFLGAHLVPASTGLHTRLVGALGLVPYRVLFGIVALVGLGLIVWGFGVARAAGPPILYDPPVWLRHLTLLLMIPVFVLVAATYLPGRISRAVRHPMVTAVKLWAFAHLLANGDAAAALLFGGFLAWGVIDRISLKRREAAGLVTVRGGPWRNDVVAVIVGLAVYAAIVGGLHAWLIGVPVV